MNTKRRLLDCALEELENTGVEAFSLRAVSAAAGITPMAVYRHFSNKQQLLEAVGREAFAAWERRAKSIRAAEPMDWLRQAGRLYLTFALDEPARFDACFVLRTGVERRYPRDFHEGRSPAVSLAMARVESAQNAGVLAAGDPLEIAMAFWSQLHGLAMLQRTGRMAMSRTAFLGLGARNVDYVLAGFRTRSAGGAA